MTKKIKILNIVGARPNFIKIAGLIKAYKKNKHINSLLVHTGQHYTANMSNKFFEELNIPTPDINLEVGSGSHALQTSKIIKRFEPVLIKNKPDAILVVGDVNSTFACALVAAKLGIKTIHVEAGLRSFDRTMPEEINRVLTDAISDILFVTESSGLKNLQNEGIEQKRIHFVGNVMIDTLEFYRELANKSCILNDLHLSSREYCVATLHRPGNVDNQKDFKQILKALDYIQKDIKIIFPIHPRTYKNLISNGMMQNKNDLPNIFFIEPLGYLDFIKLMSESKLVITDSGGIQEETTILGIPCLTVRNNTERPITITEGTNKLVGTDTDRIIQGYKKSLNDIKPYKRPKFWDGKASDRIVRILSDLL